MRKRNAVRAAAAALAAMMALTACGGGGGNETTAAAGGDTGSTAAGGDAAASGSGEVGKTDITVAMGADIVTLDPAGQQDTTTAVVIKHAYSTLLDISDEGELVPDLAESYELVNDTDFVFKLREDAVWSDGTPVTANDVKFTFDRAKNMPKTKSNTSKVKEVVVDNEHQVTIKLTEPYAPFNTIVASSNLSIVQEAAVTAAGEAYGDADNIVTSGPFTVKEWVPNDHYTLEKKRQLLG